jgi:putative peptide zinc metalloprotease protein
MQSQAISAEMMQAALTAPAKPLPQKVPPIREELRLIPAANNPDGSPAWMIQDPISNKFYRIGWLDFELLVRWQMGDIAAIVDDVNNSTTLNVDENHVKGLASFLMQHHLLQANSPQAVAGLIKEATTKKLSALSWLLHHYLFFRIPVIRPQKVLASLMPFLRWVYTPTMAYIVLGAALSGLYLVARQWDVFRSTFIDQLTLAGIFSYGVALLFSKCLHELGHAFTATRYGVRVAHMGIAMLVLLPMPYTDTSESWKLTNPKQRLHIAAAGIVTELALAAFATLFWALADDGALKNALFFLATTSWILTLAVNLSPFMRFDGYFIFSDLIDFPNLHERSGAIAKTFWRRFLLGFDEPWTEEFSPKKRRFLVAFATFTWAYRILIFLGIAWLVYYFFFKVLGIILFLVEILWFIILPNWREIKVWFERRAEIKASRIIIGAALVFCLIWLGMVPWQTSVRGTGWIHTTQQTTIFTPTPGKLVAFLDKGKVAKGETLFELTSPDIALNATRSKALAQARSDEMRGLIGMENGEEKRAQLQSEKERFNAEVKLYKDELSRMDLAAPFAGELRDVDENLAIGTWVAPKQPLAVLIDPQSWAVDVLVEEADIGRIKIGDSAKIYVLHSHLQQFAGKVSAIDSAARVQTLPHPMLDAQHGGAIATLSGDKLVPKQAFMKVRVSFVTQPSLTSMTTGNVVIETQAKAWLPSLFERVAAAFVRESGF